MGTVRDPLDELDPSARALVLDILGIFVADALAAASDGNVDGPARCTLPAVPARPCRTSRTAARPTLMRGAATDERHRNSGRPPGGEDAGRRG
jgi:hypothetical protein